MKYLCLVYLDEEKLQAIDGSATPIIEHGATP